MTFHFLDSVEDIIAILHFLRGAALSVCSLRAPMTLLNLKLLDM